MLYIDRFEIPHIKFVQTGYKKSLWRGQYDFIKIIFKDSSKLFERKPRIFRFQRFKTHEGDMIYYNSSESYIKACEQLKQYLG